MSQSATLELAAARPQRWIPWLYALTALLTCWGAILVGPASDDYANRAVLLSPAALPGILRDPLYSRAPVTVIINALLLRLPIGLAAVVKVVLHLTNALLLLRLLRHVAPTVVAAIGGAVFLVWLSSTETLYWFTAGYNIYALSFGLAALLLLQHGRYVLSVPVLLLGMLSSEALIPPALLMAWAILWHRRVAWRWQFAYLGTVVTLFFGYYIVFRRLISSDGTLVQYGIGPHAIIPNGIAWVKMLFGLITSQDQAWMWNRVPYYSFGMVLLPATFLLLAALLGAGLGWSIIATTHREPAPATQPRLPKLVVVLLVGLASTAVPFLPLSGHFMQGRMIYLATPFVGALIGIGLSYGILSRRKAVQGMAIASFAALLTLGVYMHWSATLANFYPARVVGDVLLDDVQQTYAETKLPNIFLVNAPGGVGISYAMGRDWAYRAVGAMYVGVGEQLVCIDGMENMFTGRPVGGNWCAARAPEVYTHAQPEVGQPVMAADGGLCVFLGWEDGKRLISLQARWGADGPVLDCATNTIRAAAPGEMPLQFNPAESSKQAIGEFCEDRCALPEPIYDVVVRSVTHN